MYKEIDDAHLSFFGSYIYTITNGKISSIGKNMCSKSKQNISMDCVIMKKDAFLKMILDTVQSGEHMYLIDAINAQLLKSEVNLFKFNGYVKCINDIRSYREFSRNILKEEVSDEIFRNPNGQIGRAHV